MQLEDSLSCARGYEEKGLYMDGRATITRRRQQYISTGLFHRGVPLSDSISYPSRDVTLLYFLPYYSITTFNTLSTYDFAVG